MWSIACSWLHLSYVYCRLTARWYQPFKMWSCPVMTLCQVAIVLFLLCYIVQNWSESLKVPTNASRTIFGRYFNLFLRSVSSEGLRLAYKTFGHLVVSHLWKIWPRSYMPKAKAVFKHRNHYFFWFFFAGERLILKELSQVKEQSKVMFSLLSKTQLTRETEEAVDLGDIHFPLADLPAFENLEKQLLTEAQLKAKIVSHFYPSVCLL